MTTIDPNDISLVDNSEEYLPYVLDYWFRSPPGYHEERGADPKKMSTEAEMREFFLRRFEENRRLPKSKLSGVIILYQGQPIGAHSILPLHEGDYGVFHAHIFRPELRGRGIGLISYPKACQLFMERFHLKKILFKTPAQNTSAIRVKEKLGIRCIGEEIIDFSIIRAGTRAKVFELTASECEELSKKRPL